MKTEIILLILFTGIFSAANNSSLDKCNYLTNTFEFNKNIYYEASIELITKDSAGAYVGSHFYPKISITLLNPSINFTEEDFEFFVYGPRQNELYHQSFPVPVTPHKTQTFMLIDPISNNPKGWPFEETGSYRIEIVPKKNIQENNRIFIVFDDNCIPNTPTGQYNGKKIYNYYSSFDAQPSYQKDFVEWQKQTKIQDDIQSEFMKNISITQTNLAEKSVGLSWVSLLLATGALFLAAIQTITKPQFPRIQLYELLFMDVTIICFMLAVLMGILILVFEIKIDRLNFGLISVGGIIFYKYLLKPHLSKPSSSNLPKQ